MLSPSTPIAIVAVYTSNEQSKLPKFTESDYSSRGCSQHDGGAGGKLACESRDNELKSRAAHLFAFSPRFTSTTQSIKYRETIVINDRSKYKAASMIAGWDDLAYNENYERYGEFNELKAWLRSQTQESQTTITPTSHHLDLLRTALQAAIYEIRDNLDDQISLLVTEADEFHIVVRQGDYYRTRVDDWDGMLPTDIDEMDGEECVDLLHAAKAEIAWLVNEISRLQYYISAERISQKFGYMERTTRLRPMPRKELKRCERVRDEDGKDKEGDVEMGEETEEELDGAEIAAEGLLRYHLRSPSVEPPG